MSTRDITLQEQAREITRLREVNQGLYEQNERLWDQQRHLERVLEVVKREALTLEQERDNAILERDVAQAEAAE